MFVNGGINALGSHILASIFNYHQEPFLLSPVECFLCIKVVIKVRLDKEYGREFVWLNSLFDCLMVCAFT